MQDMMPRRPAHDPEPSSGLQVMHRPKLDKQPQDTRVSTFWHESVTSLLSDPDDDDAASSLSSSSTINSTSTSSSSSSSSSGEKRGRPILPSSSRIGLDALANSEQRWTADESISASVRKPLRGRSLSPNRSILADESAGSQHGLMRARMDGSSGRRRASTGVAALELSLNLSQALLQDESWTERNPDDDDDEDFARRRNHPSKKQAPSSSSKEASFTVSTLLAPWQTSISGQESKHLYANGNKSSSHHRRTTPAVVEDGSYTMSALLNTSTKQRAGSLRSHSNTKEDTVLKAGYMNVAGTSSRVRKSWSSAHTAVTEAMDGSSHRSSFHQGMGSSERSQSERSNSILMAGSDRSHTSGRVRKSWSSAKAAVTDPMDGSSNRMGSSERSQSEQSNSILMGGSGRCHTSGRIRKSWSSAYMAVTDTMDGSSNCSSLYQAMGSSERSGSERSNSILMGGSGRSHAERSSFIAGVSLMGITEEEDLESMSSMEDSEGRGSDKKTVAKPKRDNTSSIGSSSKKQLYRRAVSFDARKHLSTLSKLHQEDEDRDELRRRRSAGVTGRMPPRSASSKDIPPGHCLARSLACRALQQRTGTDDSTTQQQPSSDPKWLTTGNDGQGDDRSGRNHSSPPRRLHSRRGNHRQRTEARRSAPPKVICVGPLLSDSESRWGS